MAAPHRVVVVGSGVMGAWTALWLRRSGTDVLLLDLYGPGNSLSSSGDESRVIRVAHGADEFYPRWVLHAWEAWRDLERAAGIPLLHEIGTLWFAHDEAGFETASARVLAGLGVESERLEPAEVARRYPGVAPDGFRFAMFEPRAGALMARRAVATVADEFVRAGGELRIARALPPSVTDADGALGLLTLADGSVERADAFVFAGGPWLRSLFPDLLGATIGVTRQEVLYMAPPPGDGRFRAGALPVWVDYDEAFYGIPSLENRGFKLAPDWPGPEMDPDREERRPSETAVAATRAFLARRFPALADAPLSEARVCQYESTPDGHFLIDRHPALADSWIVGGGSGHGFKHGPAIGEYVAALVRGESATAAALAPPDARFRLGPRTPQAVLRTSGRPPADATERR